MTLYEIRKIDPGYEKRLRDGAFNAAKDKEISLDDMITFRIMMGKPK